MDPDLFGGPTEYRTRLRASVVDWGRVRAFASDDVPYGDECMQCGRVEVADELIRNHGWCDLCQDYDQNEDWF